MSNLSHHRPTVDEVVDRDTETLAAIERAGEAVGEALRLMPNDRRSTFDPSIDVVELERARRILTVLQLDRPDGAERVRFAAEQEARIELERHDRERRVRAGSGGLGGRS